MHAACLSAASPLDEMLAGPPLLLTYSSCSHTIVGSETSYCLKIAQTNSGVIRQDLCPGLKVGLKCVQTHQGCYSIASAQDLQHTLGTHHKLADIQRFTLVIQQT